VSGGGWEAQQELKEPAMRTNQTKAPAAISTIDIGKTTFHPVGLDECGVIVLQHPA
jgi:hypothetical protein